jgi:hypothetical protein
MGYSVSELGAEPDEYRPVGSPDRDGNRAYVDPERVLRGNMGDGALVISWYGREMRDERYLGRCKGCKRPVSALMPGIVQRRTENRYGRTVETTWTSVYVYGERGTDDWKRLLPCPDCGASVAVRPVEGRISLDTPCDSRCTSAKGHRCECSCGGLNHGSDHS